MKLLYFIFVFIFFGQFVFAETSTKESLSTKITESVKNGKYDELDLILYDCLKGVTTKESRQEAISELKC